MTEETYDVNLLDHKGKILKTTTFDTTDQCIKWFGAMGIEISGEDPIQRNIISYTLPSPNDAELLLSLTKPPKEESNTVSLRENGTLSFDEAVRLGKFMWRYGKDGDVEGILSRYKSKSSGLVRGFDIASAVHTLAIWSEG